MGTGTPSESLCGDMGTGRPQYGDKTPGMGARNPIVSTGLPPKRPYMGIWGQEDPSMGTGAPIWGQGPPNCPYIGTERPQYEDRTPDMGTRNLKV